MSLPKKGSRLISISNKSFRYMITERNLKSEIIIEQENVKGAKLHVITGLEKGIPVTPGMIRRLIELAIKEGWRPEAKGNPYIFTSADLID